MELGPPEHGNGDVEVSAEVAAIFVQFREEGLRSLASREADCWRRLFAWRRCASIDAESDSFCAVTTFTSASIPLIRGARDAPSESTVASEYKKLLAI